MQTIENKVPPPASRYLYLDYPRICKVQPHVKIDCHPNHDSKRATQKLHLHLNNLIIPPEGCSGSLLGDIVAGRVIHLVNCMCLI